MMEGDLLEVYLPETQHIWRILQANEPISDDKIQELLKDSDKTAKPGDKKRKKEEESNDSNTTVEPLPVEEKKIKKIKPKDTVKSDNKKKRKRKNNEALKAIVAMQDDDEYAICAISEATENKSVCLQPTGDEVDWVQCDGGCEGWFHCVCANITAEEAKDMDYICEKCKATQKKLKYLDSSMISPKSHFIMSENHTSQTSSVAACVS